MSEPSPQHCARHTRPSPIEQIENARQAASGDALGEAAVQQLVCNHLALRARTNVVWFAIPNGGLRGSKVEAARMKAQGVKAGAPDLMIFCDGRTFGLELKTVRGRLSGAQSAMLAKLEAAGVTVGCAYGLNHALQLLKDWDVLK